jgi:hypothetical protein
MVPFTRFRLPNVIHRVTRRDPSKPKLAGNGYYNDIYRMRSRRNTQIATKNFLLIFLTTASTKHRRRFLIIQPQADLHSFRIWRRTRYSRCKIQSRISCQPFLSIVPSVSKIGFVYEARTHQSCEKNGGEAFGSLHYRVTYTLLIRSCQRTLLASLSFRSDRRSVWWAAAPHESLRLWHSETKEIAKTFG